MNQNFRKLSKMMETGDGSISRKDALANGVPPATFARYVRLNQLAKIRRGVYAKTEGTVDDLYQFQRRYPKIVYSGITALYLLGLTDRIPDLIEFTVAKGYRVRKESAGSRVICHVENNAELFGMGNVNSKTIFGNIVTCFSKEKMVVEMMRKRDEYDSELFLKALKTFLKGTDKEMDFLFEYARMRKIEEKVYRILEAMDYEN
ncbi:MAG: type IV toxin-antitoxin system AbiEi family antitoxin domain-containing protein [bacterium]|nr:type IV toxin-antitoxin system AbiEi family antitoxin domain-containing protein [bacterium]